MEIRGKNVTWGSLAAFSNIVSQVKTFQTLILQMGTVRKWTLDSIRKNITFIYIHVYIFDILILMPAAAVITVSA